MAALPVRWIDILTQSLHCMQLLDTEKLVPLYEGFHSFSHCLPKSSELIFLLDRLESGGGDFIYRIRGRYLSAQPFLKALTMSLDLRFLWNNMLLPDDLNHCGFRIQ
jgi:hypothetical protein